MICRRHDGNLLGTVLLLIAFVGTSAGASVPDGPPDAGVEFAPKEPPPAATKETVAPWSGLLETQSLYIHAPPSITNFDRTPDQTPIWRFRHATIASVKALLEEAEVPPAMQAALLATAVARRENGNLTLVPTPDVILALPPKSRQRIYEELAKSAANPYHFTPLLIPQYLADEWLLHCKLSQIQRDCIRQLFWTRGRCFAFSDISLLIRTARSTDEVRECRSALTLTRALMVKLRMPTREQLDAVMAYWGAEPNHRDVASFLFSAADAGGTEAIDLIHLLPPLCRERLNTYPSLASGVGGRFPDCNWTALNFFTSRPEPYYLDSHSSFLELKQNYEPIEAASKLGDLICFTDKAGQVYHSCVYIADNIVFSKNGAGLVCPWLLMPYADVEAIYRYGEVSEVRYFRKKLPSPQDE